LEPAGGVAGWLRAAQGVGEQVLDFPDAERDQAWVCGRLAAGSGWRRGLGVGALAELGGGDGADREGGHDQDEVAQDGGVEAGLALVQAEAVLGQLEAFLSRPPLMPMKWNLSLAMPQILG
jgi:hypothetical protein